MATDGKRHRRRKKAARTAAAALTQVGVDYAVIGGNAVAAWVSRVDESAIEATPELGETEKGDGFDLIPLADLVRMKLISFRDKDRMHLRDLIAVGLVDVSWPRQFPIELARRLQIILDDPEG